MLCLLFGSASHGALYLVEDGRVAAECVLPDDAPKVVCFAAADLKRWIREMTGAEIPLVEVPTSTSNTKLLIGKRAAAEFLGDLQKLAGTDGFAIRRRGNKVHVFGDRPRGTAFGLFALLERNSDIIWARPNADFGTVFGRHKDLVLRETDVLDIPVFRYRSFGGGHPPHLAGAEWQLRNGLNRPGRGQFDAPGWDIIPKLSGNLYWRLKKHFAEHPEWFGLNPLTGKRVCGAGEGTLCLTRPELPEVWARAAIEGIREKEAASGRKAEIYTVGPGDNWFCCCCPECLKPIALPDGSVLEMKHPDSIKDPLFRSTQYHQFLNRVMKIWKKEVPHVKLVSLAYIYVAEPPAVDLDPDLCIYFAPYPTNSMRHPLSDPRQPELWRRRFEQWRRKTRNLGFYEYYFSKPSPQAFYAAANLRSLLTTCDPDNAYIYTEYNNDRGTKGIGEGALGWDVGAMHTWVIARLFWNPNRDVDELYRHYIGRTYREAAPQMTRYYERIRDSWLDPNNKADDACHSALANVYRGLIIQQGLEKETHRLLEEAEQVAGHPHSRMMIQRMRNVFASYAKGMARMVVANVAEMAHDGDTFDSVQWEKPRVLDDFKVTQRLGALREPSQRTALKAARTDQHLYIRFTAYDTEMESVLTRERDEQAERWPRGDHAELWFALPHRKPFVFAFDANGTAYDAREYDRDWNSNWRLMTRRIGDRWEAIAVIPLASLGLQPEEKPRLQWFCVREIHHEHRRPEYVSYQGRPLFRKMYPIEWE